MKKRSMRINSWILTACVVGFVYGESPAQSTFYKTFGNTDGPDRGKIVKVLPDGNVIIGGETQSFGLGVRSVYFVETDANGKHLWTSTISGSIVHAINDFKPLPDGGLVVAAERYLQGNRESLWLIKTDPNGALVWQQPYDENGNEVESNSIEIAPDGGFMITGFTKIATVAADVFYTMKAEQQYLYLLKTDANGKKQWSKKLEVSEAGFTASGIKIENSADGGYIILGTLNNTEAQVFDSFLMKISSTGALQWTKRYASTDYASFSHMHQTTDGGYLLTGTAKVSGDAGLDIALLKLDAQGNTQWSKALGGPQDERGISAAAAHEGGYIISGETRSFGVGLNDIYLLKTDANGTPQWARTFGGERYESGSEVAVVNDGYILTGFTMSYEAGNSDMVLIKTDRAGNGACESKSDINTQVRPLSISTAALAGAKLSEIKQDRPAGATDFEQYKYKLTMQESRELNRCE